jgi:hypothetical protein
MSFEALAAERPRSHFAQMCSRTRLLLLLVASGLAVRFFYLRLAAVPEPPPPPPPRKHPARFTQCAASAPILVGTHVTAEGFEPPAFPIWSEILAQQAGRFVS